MSHLCFGSIGSHVVTVDGGLHAGGERYTAPVLSLHLDAQLVHESDVFVGMNPGESREGGLLEVIAEYQLVGTKLVRVSKLVHYHTYSLWCLRKRAEDKRGNTIREGEREEMHAETADSVVRKPDQTR